MPLELWSAQFNIVGGLIQEEGPFVGVFEGTQHASGMGVYFVVEPVGSATPRLCDEVLDVLARAFGAPEIALTDNLLRALGAGHQHVREWNRLYGSNGAAGVGVSCLAVRGEEAYLAQCGSSLAVAHTSGRFRVAMPTGDDSRRPLGMGDRAAPIFNRMSLAIGDVILLTFSATDQLVDRGTLISLVTAPPEEAMPALYMRVRSAAQFGALYLAVIQPPAPDTFDDAFDTRHAGPAPPSRPYAPDPEAARPSQRAVATERPSRPIPSPPLAPIGVNGHDPEDQRWAPRRPQTRSARRGVDLGLLGRQGRLPSQRVILLAVAALAIILLLWLALPALARRGNDDRFQELVTTADGAAATAQTDADPVRRRTLLGRAQADLREALAIRPDAVEVHERLTRVVAALSAIDGAIELDDLTPIADLADVGLTPHTAVELAVADRLYLLDAASGRVFAFDGFGGRPETVYDEGRVIGGDRTAKARHITVVPDNAGGAGTLVVLDSARRLYAVPSTGNLLPVALAGADSWKNDTALAATTAALYVLDAAGEQIWRFTGTATGYDRPESLGVRSSLKTGSGLSVGGVPIVAADSRLLRIAEGREEEIRPAAIDRPLASPSAPLFNPADGMLYIADRGNRRIVLVDAAGNFQGQLVHHRLAALRSVALDEARGVLYAVSGQALLRAKLPPK